MNVDGSKKVGIFKMFVTLREENYPLLTAALQKVPPGRRRVARMFMLGELGALAVIERGADRSNDPKLRQPRTSDGEQDISGPRYEQRGVSTVPNDSFWSRLLTALRG